MGVKPEHNFVLDDRPGGRFVYKVLMLLTVNPRVLQPFTTSIVDRFSTPLSQEMGFSQTSTGTNIMTTAVCIYKKLLNKGEI
jgi:hypothetical protein